MKKNGVLIFSIALVLLVRTAYYYAQPDLCTDHISQMASVHNFIDGHGFSFKYLDTQQQVYYKTHIQWPPLYPLILSFVSFITANTLLSSFFIQITTMLFLVIVWKRIFNFFKNIVSEDTYFYFITLLIVSTSILNNINTILVVALLILSLSLYFTFAYLLLDKFRKLNLFLSSFFASLLFWTHYSYFLVAFYPAVVLLIIFYSGRNKTYFFASVSSFVISLVVASGVILYNFLSTGFINYMDNPGIWDAGFFPEHLLLTDPFFLNSFFKSAYLIDYIFNSNQKFFLDIIFQIVSFIILIVIVMLFFKLRKNKNIPFEKTFLLFLPFIVIIILTITFLLYFTLHYHEIPRPGWTHIGDARYLSAVYMSVIAIVLMLVFIKADYINNKIVKAFKATLICLIVISLSVNIYITEKEWGKYTFNKNYYKNFQEDLQTLFDNVKLELSKGKIPVFVNNDLTVRSFRMSQFAGAAVINVSELKEIKQFPSNMVFFFILPGEERYYRDKDFQLLDWGSRFNLRNIGNVYNKVTLYNVDLFQVNNGYYEQ